MLMKELNLRNSEFKELLDELAKRATYLIEERPDIINKGLEWDYKRQDPVTRKKEGYDEPYKHAPDWDMLPDDFREQGNYMDPCGHEYLDLQIKRLKDQGPTSEGVTCGWPNKEVFTGAMCFEKNVPEYIKLPAEQQLHEIVRKISYDFLGGSSIALCAIYPPGGYIPWHNNGNAPGHNLLLHYSLGGDGEFITYHEGEIVTYKDKDREWIARAGAFLSTHGQPEGEGRAHPQFDVGNVHPSEAEKASWHCARTNSWRITLSTIIPQYDMWKLVQEELEEE